MGIHLAQQQTHNEYTLANISEQLPFPEKSMTVKLRSPSLFCRGFLSMQPIIKSQPHDPPADTIDATVVKAWKLQSDVCAIYSCRKSSHRFLLRSCIVHDVYSETIRTWLSVSTNIFFF